MNKIDEDSDAGLEALSAYMDGELPAPERDGLLQAVKSGASIRADWCVYHCIGDVLRSDETACLSGDVEQRFKGRFEQEPFLFAPEVAKAFAAQRSDSAGKWRMPLSVAASVAALLVVGSVVVIQHSAEPLQSAQAPVKPAVAPQLVPQAPGVDAAAGPVSNEYLMAHRNYSAGLAMRGVVSHVRTAGYDGK